jgi:hypothetical protein
MRLSILRRLMYIHVKTKKVNYFRNFLSGIRVSCPTFAFRPGFLFSLIFWEILKNNDAALYNIVELSILYHLI